MTYHKSRRTFIKKSVLTSAGLAIGLSAKSYGRIIGANDRVNLAVAGLNSRGNAHISAARNMGNKAKVVALCDVDNRIFKKAQKQFSGYLDSKTKTFQDIRLLLEDKDIDAITVATPDHWHAPMAIMAMQADKHVFLEKPCSHNPQEGDWLIKVQKQTGMKLQIGNQQRSSPTSIEVIGEIGKGLIGKVSYAKAWYANTRGSIGQGKSVSVPSWLNWDLWQGPAPRKEYKDNLVHYNWHWFWNWGTGEINNNGLHELDICRWALNVQKPIEVTSSGGRYHFSDDWEFYDTQVASFQFESGAMINWEGRSCNGFPLHNRSRGASVHGDAGTVILDRGGYEVYDKGGKLIKERKEGDANASAAQDLVGLGGLDNYHMLNFLHAIQKDEPLNSPIKEANDSNLLCHLGNISQKTGKVLTIDPVTGKPNDPEAQKMWTRQYEPGWEPKV